MGGVQTGEAGANDDINIFVGHATMMPECDVPHIGAKTLPHTC